ncbi:MAG: hypothetical protein UX22_C0015G0001 [Candidatus Jorgensenbacteria bacterium GW2011_GWA2_45_9]|uniref:Integrase catalytic domain-containing protein n=1 Tax=Candidatus Jorgensenbacteria bacterium GW2011_GWA2_45_9 TaxID=1618663 RepID=A0A0G1N3G3_9BACT|nr:MAG: hypothetical protein UX22_C0015G0001 [Candidatus Jorgensenbacteria bacterium GW2011_GWA2_45_9]
MNMETKKQIFERYKNEYYKARVEKRGGRKRRGEILDIVCDISHMARKAASRKFTRLQTKDPRTEEKRGRAVYYTADVTAALKDVWSASNGLCGELLHPLIPDYVAIFRRDGTWKNSDDVTDKLLKMSERTVKRRVTKFEHIKRKGQGFSSTSPSSVKTIIPVFMGPWKDTGPGHEQIDTVVHCGSTLRGDMVYTLNSTDVATYWNLLGAQWNKGEEATIENRARLRKRLPFKHLHDHSDTGGEFINWATLNWNKRAGIMLTRSRPNKKNDNAYVEERNGHIVRKYVGYIRLDCTEAVEVLNNLYLQVNTYTNHFISSRKTIDTVREGSKYKRTYEKALTPYQRVRAHSMIPEKVKAMLCLEHAKLNPAVLLKEIERLRTILYDVQRKHGSQIT